MSLEFTLVRRAISLAVIDGPDADDEPDILQAQGSVLFEPVIKKGDSIQVQTRGGSETYALAPIECPINDGIISHRGQDGVKLPAGGEAANPSLIRWKATFSRMQAGGKSFTLAPVVFDAVPGGEIDLTMVAPVAGAPEGVVRGPRGTSLESIIVDGSELVFTAVDDAGSFEIARIPLDEMVRAEADAAADGVRDALAVDVAASQSARDAAEGHADRASTSESNAAASESAAKQSETTAGDFAAVATTAATEAVDAMERATDLAGGNFATHEYVDSLKPEIERGNYGRILSTLDVASYDTIPPGDYTALTPFFQGVGLTGVVGSGTFSRILTNYSQDGALKLDIARWVLSGKVYEFYRARATSGWSDWISRQDEDTLATERARVIPDGADWNDIDQPGEYRRSSTTVAAVNGPTENPTLGVLAVHSPQHRSGQVTQTFYGAGGGGYWHRAKTSNRWTPWIRMDVVPESPDAPSRMHAGEARREALVELGKRKRGGVIGTGGLPAVALRFDHHLDYFDTKVLPLLKQYGLPWMQAVNAGNMGKGNDNWTAAKLATECHNSGGEVYNHGLDHSTYTTNADADRQITGGLTQLTNALPSLHIDGWAPYGSFPQGAYEAGKSAEDFYSTYPGQLILAQHAFVRSYLPGQHERLAGAQMVGGTHSTIDKDTTGAAIRGLKAAMARGMGITFMLHPVYLDQEGYMSTAQFEALLAEIAARRDAGELRVLSCTGIMLADKARPDDFNLLGTLSAPNATGSENVNSRGYAITSGVPHEAEVWATGSGTLTLTATVDSPTYPVSVTSEVTLTSTPKRLAILFTPPNDTTGITVSLTGDVQHTGVKYRPI